MRFKFLPPLIAALSLIAAAALPPCAAAQGDAPAPFILHQVGPGIWAAIDNPAAKSARSGANAGFIIGTDSVLVVDTFENPDPRKCSSTTFAKKQACRFASW